jgi:hypothetical protein
VQSLSDSLSGHLKNSRPYTLLGRLADLVAQKCDLISPLSFIRGFFSSILPRELNFGRCTLLATEANNREKNMKKSFIALGLTSLLSVSAIAAPQASSAEGATAYIISPAAGETVAQTFTVKFGLSGMGVAPAGSEKANTGHHHLLIDADELPALDQAMTSEVTHFGGGQTETSLTLSPGTHTLQLMLGDKGHVPHDSAVISEKITITVK